METQNKNVCGVVREKSNGGLIREKNKNVWGVVQKIFHSAHPLRIEEGLAISVYKVALNISILYSSKENSLHFLIGGYCYNSHMTNKTR